MTEPLALPAATTWTTDQLHFQAWLAVPSGAREPRSQRELAAQLEVREATLSDWKRLPGWHDAVYGLALGRLIGDLVPVLHAMAREAKGGSLPHAQWLFELAGKWDPRLKHEHTGEAGAPLKIVIETVDDRTLPAVREGS